MRDENFICIESLLEQGEITQVMLEDQLEAAEEKTKEIEKALTKALKEEARIRKELERNAILQTSLVDIQARIYFGEDFNYGI